MCLILAMNGMVYARVDECFDSEWLQVDMMKGKVDEKIKVATAKIPSRMSKKVASASQRKGMDGYSVQSKRGYRGRNLEKHSKYVDHVYVDFMEKIEH